MECDVTIALQDGYALLDDYVMMRKIEDSYKKFTDTLWEEGVKQNEDLKPQVRGGYMGRVFPYTNYKRRMSTNELNTAIDNEFWRMTSSEYKSHPLCDFYKPRRIVAS
eukprot:1870464-Prymnesium_polylepis.1